MSLRRKLILGTTLLAIALAGPAPAQAEELFWYDHDEKYAPTFEKPKKVKPLGVLTFSVETLLGEFKAGPCESFELTGTLYNSKAMGEGEFTGVEFLGANCPTSVAGCTVQGFEFGEFPWEATLTTNAQVETRNLVIVVRFAKECEKFSIPSELLVTGTAIGTFIFNAESNQSELVFEESGNLISEFGFVSLDGSVVFGTKVTALSEL
jgi:hypothetical protein